MRDQRPLWRPIVATFGALVVVLSAMGCDPPSAGEADPRPAAEVQPNDTQPPAEADATPAPVEEAAVPTQPPVREPEPRTTPMVEVGITRPPAEVHVTRPPVEIDGAGSACSPNWDRPEWLFREFVQWTPDGSTVLFTDGPHIYAVAADGSRLWDVAVPAAGEGKPVGPMAPFTVSPDGKQVIYATCNYGRSSELARVGVDGTQPQQLTVNSRFESHPAWSPDGKRIAFLAAAQVSGGASDLRPRLYTMAPDGSATRPVRMAAAAELLPLPPQWSPDSKHIAYTQREVGGRVGLYTVAVDGRDPPQRLSATVSSASWSPDGTRIAFAKPEPDTVSLFTIAVGGWDAQRLRTMPLNHWRPRPPYAAAEPSRAWIETVAWSRGRVENSLFMPRDLRGRPGQRTGGQCIAGREYVLGPGRPRPIAERYGRDTSDSPAREPGGMVAKRLADRDHEHRRPRSQPLPQLCRANHGGRRAATCGS